MKKLLLLYVDAARAHGDATEKGDHKSANRCAETLGTLYKQICESGEPGAQALRSLMSHRDQSVRYWAAYHCLPYAPLEVEATLAEIAKGRGTLVSFSAQITVEQWRRGGLRIGDKQSGL